MPLTGIQSQQLRDALLMGRFSEPEYEQLMSDEMNVRVWEVIPRGVLASVAFSLVAWCDGQGRIGELLAAIAKARKHHQAVLNAVARLAQELGLPAPAAAPPQPAATAAVPDSRPVLTRVREVLLGLFPNRDKLILLVEDQFGEDYNAIVGIPSPEREVRELVRWADTNRDFRLRPLLAAVIAQHPNSPELIRLYQELYQV